MKAEEEEGEEASYLDFTKKWIKAVDRGGLFHIDDEVYVLFYQMEILIKTFLTEIFTEHSQHDKGEIISEVVSDSDIEFHWSMLATDLDENVGKELLTEIAQLWLTIRGFSMAGSFVEQYKEIVKKTTKKSGLRKELKRKKLDMDSVQ